jgi:hypothetical protein
LVKIAGVKDSTTGITMEKAPGRGLQSSCQDAAVEAEEAEQEDGSSSIAASARTTFASRWWCRSSEDGEASKTLAPPGGVNEFV